jgi:hypothetical protein
MAESKEIKGKKDKGKHEGKRSEIRRVQKANFDLKEWLGIRRKK